MALAISYALESFGLVYLASPTATAPPSFLLLEPAGHPPPSCYGWLGFPHSVHCACYSATHIVLKVSCVAYMPAALFAKSFYLASGDESGTSSVTKLTSEGMVQIYP